MKSDIFIDRENDCQDDPRENPEKLFQQGLDHACGRTGTTNLVEAHKWFNLAANFGFQPAFRYRQEISAEMTSGEIAAAQRAAREFIARHFAR